MHKTGPLKQMVKPRWCDRGLKVREAAERCRSSSTPGWGPHKCWPGKRPPLCAPCGNLLSQGSQLGKAQIWPNRHWPKDVKAFWNFALQEDKLVELNNNNNKLVFCAESLKVPAPTQHYCKPHLAIGWTSRTKGRQSLWTPSAGEHKPYVALPAADAMGSA